ncbi:folylpolyglutamate synthase, mitochondrial-like isoform X2 [Dendronephthya gigantea]|uniref:folylpolyglutamate synthase, mitochondrial-like isoform X2 n=1 Tax=Dendronephthya gigantea TaxID=151771 RepID=UPI00106C4E57|nr:folylpolyglutamate synthase, mitochondrial-like isoform X2 [Dendronephthya gigantea]
MLQGSVCAFCESIMRHSGYRTGFYSSPHIFEVRERMRVDGMPISKEKFANYFFECWENFEMEKKRYYKTFLVNMAFHVFLKEKVDVTVVEVGCGGEYDATNILRHPVVCGITLLDKDHLKSLGGTVESIAWHKSGIFKPGVPAFTFPQNSASMKVLMERAEEKKISLKVVPDFISKISDGSLPVLGIEGKHQNQNASLALHLCRTWIKRRNEANEATETQKEVKSSCETESPYAEEFPLPESFKEGLAKVFWPGRTQCVERDDITFYLDGAHTRKSIEACTEWFCEKSRMEKLKKSHKKIAKILIFNFKGERNARSLIQPLVQCDFDYVIFCPNLLQDGTQLTTSDTYSFYTDKEKEKKKCHEIQDIWREVLSFHKHSDVSPIHTSELNSRVFTCVSDAFHWVVDNQNDPGSSLRNVIGGVEHVQVFVTGSLLLVSLVLQLLEAVEV